MEHDLRTLAAACRRQARITACRLTRESLERIAVTYEREAEREERRAAMSAAARPRPNMAGAAHD
ncbi:MAG: hypothetical protein ACK40O_05715 [Allosphingosinicella sp.]